MQSPEHPLHSHLRRPGIFLRNCLLQPGERLIRLTARGVDGRNLVRRVNGVLRLELGQRCCRPAPSLPVSQSTPNAIGSSRSAPTA